MISLMGGSTKSFLPQGDKVQTFLIMLLIFLVKVYLVQFSYNYVAPKLIKDFGNKDTDFTRLTFTQAIFLVILANNLFR